MHHRFCAFGNILDPTHFPFYLFELQSSLILFNPDTTLSFLLFSSNMIFLGIIYVYNLFIVGLDTILHKVGELELLSKSSKKKGRVEILLLSSLVVAALLDRQVHAVKEDWLLVVDEKRTKKKTS